MKPSRYLVASDDTYHAMDGSRLRLVYATRSARLCALPEDVAADLLAGRLPDTDAQAGAFLRDGQMVVDDGDELAQVRDGLAAAARDRSTRHIALLPTSYCNMGCAYCGQEHVKGKITTRHREAVRRRVVSVMTRPEVSAVRLDWFGGEPLLAFDIIRDLARTFTPIIDDRDLDWTSVLVTNGALLDHRKIAILAGECRVTHAEITLDGPPHIHDTHRPLKSGQGSFWRTVRVIREAVHDDTTAPMTFGIRTNVDVENEHAVSDLISLLVDEGLGHDRVRIGIKPVHSWGNDVDALKVGLERFAAMELEWMRQMREAGLNFETLPSEPTRGVCVAVNPSNELITAQGEVFSCSEHPLVPVYRDKAVGSLDASWADTGEPRPEGEYESWHDQIHAAPTPCSTCVFYPVCGGSCPKAWAEGTIACPSYKFNVQGRMREAARTIGLTPAAG